MTCAWFYGASWNVTKFREFCRILSPKINQKIVGVGLVISYSCCPSSSRFEYTFFAFPPFQRSRANTTSSIKPEVHDVSQRHRRRPRATAIRNMHQHSVKIGRGVSEICSLTNRQADTQTRYHITTILRFLTGSGTKSLGLFTTFYTVSQKKTRH